MIIIIPLLINGAAAQNWELVWSDEFDYNGLPDTNRWSFDVEGNAWDWGNNELQNYTPADKMNAWVENGNCIIEARKEKWTFPGDGQERDYTSARLRTIHKGDWCYGKVAVRAQLPGGRGTWPAIWMLSTDNAYGTWPRSGELDIMEHVGYDSGRVHATIHTEKYNHMNGTQQGDTIILSDPMNTFNVYSLEWFEDHVSFFANDDTIFTFQNEGTGYQAWPFDKRFHLLINIAVGGRWGGQQGVDTTIFPVRMAVDYVRVYEASDAVYPSLNKGECCSPIRVVAAPGTNNPVVTCTLPRESSVTVTVFTLSGVEVLQQKYNRQKKGTYSIPLTDSHRLSGGVYLLLFQKDTDGVVKRFFFLK